MNSRLISIIRKEFIQIIRDPRTLVLIVVMPIDGCMTCRFADPPAGQWQDERGDRAAEAEASEDLSRRGVPREDDEARPISRTQDPCLHQARNIARSGTSPS